MILRQVCSAPDRDPVGFSSLRELAVSPGAGASVPHADIVIPAEAYAAPLPDTLSERIRAIDVDVAWQTEPRCKVMDPTHGAAMHDPQALFFDGHVRLRRGSMRDGKIVDEHAVPVPVFVGNGVSVLKSCIEDLVVVVADPFHFIRLKKAKPVFSRQFLDDRAGHAQVKPYAFLAGHRMIMHQWMDDARG